MFRQGVKALNFNMQSSAKSNSTNFCNEKSVTKLACRLTHWGSFWCWLSLSCCLGIEMVNLFLEQGRARISRAFWAWDFNGFLICQRQGIWSNWALKLQEKANWLISCMQLQMDTVECECLIDSDFGTERDLRD